MLTFRKMDAAGNHITNVSQADTIGAVYIGCLWAYVVSRHSNNAITYQEDSNTVRMLSSSNDVRSLPPTRQWRGTSLSDKAFVIHRVMCKSKQIVLHLTAPV